MKYIDRITITFFCLISITGILEHFLILYLSQEYNLRVFQAFTLGLGYDLMNGAILSLIILFTPMPIFYRKIICSILGCAFMLFVFIDFNYVLIFGTHLPFSTIEYLNESSSFFNSMIYAIKSYSFWVLFFCPTVVLLFLLFLYDKNRISKNNKLLPKLITLLFLILLGGSAASYSNSYVAKNMENPLTSAAIQYFYLTRNREPIEKISRPINSLKIIKNLIPDQIPSGEHWKNYPLVRVRNSLGCQNENNSIIKQKLCSEVKKPNIIILMLESFRTAEIGVYGSKLGLTPKFDYWSKKGILFENFFANGFQTRHAQVATYCSIFPNYGAAVMKRYNRNNFRCLPEILKEYGYATSWVFGSDSNFDGQSSFLAKIGFDKIIDKFDFHDSASILGWGLSDKELFVKLENVLDNEKQPFFSSALTSTNHHPYEVPTEYKLNRGQSVKARYQEAIYYTDAMLGDFLNRVTKKTWFKNTIIFITADTSSFQPSETNPKNFDEFVKLRSQIPLLILLGENIISEKEPKRYIFKKTTDQVDIGPTIMDILKKEIIVPWVGRSIIENEENNFTKTPFRAYTNRPGAYWAVIEKESRYYRENNVKDHYFGDQSKVKYDYLKKIGKSWIDTINWILQENLIWPEAQNETKQ